MAAVGAEEITLVLHVQGLKATVDILEEGKERTVVSNVDIHALSTEVAGGFVGCTTGVFAVTDEGTSQGAALFKSLSYQGN